MSDTTFLEYIEGNGVEPAFLREPSGLEVPNPKAGEPAPLVEIGFNVPIPTMVGEDIVHTTANVKVVQAPAIDPADPVASRIIPGTRIVETNAAAVVNTLLSTGHYAVCDPPASGKAKGGKATETPASTGGEAA